MTRVSADERREQLIDATIELIRSKGVQAVTLREVANAAGSGLAAVHYCFSSKDELIHTSITKWLTTTIRSTPELSVIDDFHTTMRALADSYWTQLTSFPRDVISQLELVVLSARGNINKVGDLIYPVSAGLISTTITESLELKGESINIDPDELTRAIVAIMDGCSLQYLAAPDATELQEVYNFLFEALIDRVLDQSDMHAVLP